MRRKFSNLRWKEEEKEILEERERERLLMGEDANLAREGGTNT